MVVFDIDNIISAPSCLIGRPKAQVLTRAVCKKYKQKHWKDHIIHIHSLYHLRASEEFVEKEIKEIIHRPYVKKVLTIAFTAMCTENFGNIDDSCILRHLDSNKRVSLIF